MGLQGPAAVLPATAARLRAAPRRPQLGPVWAATPGHWVTPEDTDLDGPSEDPPPTPPHPIRRRPSSSGLVPESQFCTGSRQGLPVRLPLGLPPFPPLHVHRTLVEGRGCLWGLRRAGGARGASGLAPQLPDPQIPPLPRAFPIVPWWGGPPGRGPRGWDKGWPPLPRVSAAGGPFGRQPPWGEAHGPRCPPWPPRPGSWKFMCFSKND